MTATTLPRPYAPRARAGTGAAERRRPGWVRRPGAVLAAAGMLALVTQPALLPHLWWVQALTGGLAAAQAYGLVALVTSLASSLLRDGGRRLPEALALPGAAAVLGVGLLAGYPGELALAAGTHMPGPALATQGLALAGAVLVAIATVTLARGLRRMARAARRRPRRAAAIAVAPVLALALTAAAPTAPAPAGRAAVGSAAAGATGIGKEVGRKGAEFLEAANPEGATRVYVGEAAASTPRERARLAVDELRRTGGLDRGTVLVDVPTGSGWVNPDAVHALEHLTHGDLATVVVQYAAHPSWLSYLKGGEGVQQSVRALVDELEARTDGRVLVYGESLGAWGGLRAYPEPDDVTNHLDGALWAGVPGGRPRPEARVTTLIHPDDPVPAWSPRLMVHGTPAWPRRWLPVVSFWQATADVISAPATPEGFGHRYGDEVSGAWAHVLSTTATYDSPS